MYVYESPLEHGKYTVVNDCKIEDDDIKWNVYFTRSGEDAVLIGKFGSLAEAREFVNSRISCFTS